MVSRADGLVERLNKCPERTTDMYVSLMYVSLMYVSLMYVSLMYVSLSRLTLPNASVSLERLTYFIPRQLLIVKQKLIARLL